MQLGRLRHQILIAIGVPACWTGKSPDPVTPPPPDQQKHQKVATDDGPADPNDPWGGSPRWQPNPAAAAATRCTPETACGRSDTKHGPNGCGPHGDSLESFSGNYQKLSVTQLSWGANPQELRLFDLDPAETSQYQRTVTVGASVDRYCCYSHCTPSRPADQIPVAPIGMQLVTNCVAAPAQAKNPHRNNRDCPATQGASPYVGGTDAQCCYATAQPIPQEDPDGPHHYRGRAARVDGQAVVAPIRGGMTWTAADIQPRVDHLTATVRAALRDKWLAAAQMEHASIAAFSALSLRLLALGAPAQLIARAHEAALDEIRHAQLAFALASAYADSPLEAARFDALAQLPTASTLAALARETFLDGCIEETAAAVEASLESTTEADPVVAATLRSIADDEVRHAELAWSIVAWCVRSEPAIVHELRALLAEQPQTDVVREVVTPCLAALA